MKKILKTKKVLGAKKVVTKKDAVKVAPLVEYWEARLLKERDSDNWYILAFGAFIGFVLGIIASV